MFEKKKEEIENEVKVETAVEAATMVAPRSFELIRPRRREVSLGALFMRLSTTILK